MNATQRALLKAIAAAPHDDTPRLVYADWLDEYAADLPKKERESTAARAEIIRVQCELARLAEEDNDSRWVYEYLDTQGLSDLDSANFRVDWSEFDPGLARRVAIRARGLQLLAAHNEDWKKDETPTIEGVSFSLRRGFWTALRMGFDLRDVDPVIKLLKAQTDSIPVTDLYCECELAQDQAERLVGSGLFSHLSTLGGTLQRPLFAALGRSPIAGGVRDAHLQLADDSVALPFGRKGWSGLRSLWVLMYGETGTLESMKPLARATHLAGIDTLCIDLDGWGWWDVVDTVARGVWKNLRRLNWEGFLINDDQTKTIARGSSLKNLRYLHLGRAVGKAGVTALMTSPTLKRLVVLDLHANEIRGIDSSALQKSRRPNLRALNLNSANSTSSIGKSGLAKPHLAAVAKSPATHNLWTLALEGNELADDATKAFFRAMQMPQLAMLNLADNNKLGSATAEAIASCDRLTNLQSLDLARTKIGNAGAKALAKSKHLTKLRHLDVSQAGVAESGLAALRKRFGEDVVRG